jgi:hypothetical protein
MTTITIPAGMESTFSVTQQVAVCDQDGKVLGYYTPASQATKAEYEWLMKDVKEAEIEFSLKSGPGRSYEDIMAELRRHSGLRSVTAPAD